jgi:hypothetical protein
MSSDQPDESYPDSPILAGCRSVGTDSHAAAQLSEERKIEEINDRQVTKDRLPEPYRPAIRVQLFPAIYRHRKGLCRS